MNDIGKEATVKDNASVVKVSCIAFVVSVLMGGLVVFSDYYAVSETGGTGLKTIVSFFVFPVLLCAAFIPLALFCCIWAHIRRVAFRVMLVCILFVIVFFMSVRIGGKVRINGFRNLAVRSVPLVKAVKAYEQKYGEPPVALEALVPEFLESVPATGMAAYPKYIYRRGEEKRCDGNPWVLEVFAPSGILNFDRFYYYPLQNYPESVCSDRVERVGDWAYWHE